MTSGEISEFQHTQALPRQWQ